MTGSVDEAPADGDMIARRLALTAIGPARFSGRPVRTLRGTVFGGQILGQCLAAALGTVGRYPWPVSHNLRFYAPLDEVGWLLVRQESVIIAGPTADGGAAGYALPVTQNACLVTGSAMQAGFAEPSSSMTADQTDCTPFGMSSTELSETRTRTREPTRTGAANRTLFRP